MKTGALFLLLIVEINAILWPDFSESWTAVQKSTKMWDFINEWPYAGWSTQWLFPFKLFPFLITPIGPDQFDDATDFVQHSWTSLWMFPRIKQIHTRGVVQRIEWVDVGGH